jgi:hypothetical protein
MGFRENQRWVLLFRLADGNGGSFIMLYKERGTDGARTEERIGRMKKKVKEP